MTTEDLKNDVEKLSKSSGVFKTLMDNAKSGIPKKIQIFVGVLAAIWLIPIILDIVLNIIGVFFDYKTDLLLKFMPRLEQLITILTGVSAVGFLTAVVSLFTDADGDGIPDLVDKDNKPEVNNNNVMVNVAPKLGDNKSTQDIYNLPLHIEKGK